MSNSSENASRVNGLGIDPLQRLASFKAPRDLSLGGVKPNKKIFTPNLNVTRNKNKGPSSNNSRDHRKDEKGRKDRKNDRNKNIKNGSNIIKSSGVFSEGLGNAERHSSRVAYSRDVESTPSLRKPTIRVKDFVKIDKELEDQRIRSVVGDAEGGLSDDETEQNFRLRFERDAPVRLPVDDGGWSHKQPKTAVRVKEEVVVKLEPGEADSVTTLDVKPILEVKKEVFEDSDVLNLLRSDKPALILLQFPDSLPGRGGSVEDDAPQRKHAMEAPPSSGEGTKDELQVDKCHLTDLEEGRIGKLRVHRSGRVTCAIGTTVFEVSAGTKTTFHQELVSVGVNDESRSASLVAMGPLQHKLNILPDWEAMFAEMPI